MQTEINPYQTPQADLKLEAEVKTYGGIPRLGFFLGHIILYILITIINLLPLAMITDPEIYLRMIGFFFMFTFSIHILGVTILAVYRHKNMGYNPWWGLLMLIPIINLIIYVRCLIYPTGYNDSNELDISGKIIAAILAIVIILPILFAILLPSLITTQPLTLP